MGGGRWLSFRTFSIRVSQGPKAGKEYTPSFLLEKRHVEEVGSFFKNQAMDRHVEDPFAFLGVVKSSGMRTAWNRIVRPTHMENDHSLRLGLSSNIPRFLTTSPSSMHHVFNVRHNDTWVWEVPDLRAMLLGRPTQDTPQA